MGTFSVSFNRIMKRIGIVTLRTTFSFQTSVMQVCNDLRTEEKRQGARTGVRNEKIKKIHGVRNKTCSGDRNEEDQEFIMKKKQGVWNGKEHDVMRFIHYEDNRK
jgi:hypothetical protein